MEVLNLIHKQTENRLGMLEDLFTFPAHSVTYMMRVIIRLYKNCLYKLLTQSGKKHEDKSTEHWNAVTNPAHIKKCIC